MLDVVQLDPAIRTCAQLSVEGILSPFAEQMLPEPSLGHQPLPPTMQFWHGEGTTDAMSKCNIAVPQFLIALGSLKVTVIQSNPYVLLKSETTVKAED